MTTKYNVYLSTNNGKVRYLLASFDTHIQADNFKKNQKNGLALSIYIQYNNEHGITVHEQKV